MTPELYGTLSLPGRAVRLDIRSQNIKVLIYNGEVGRKCLLRRSNDPEQRTRIQPGQSKQMINVSVAKYALLSIFT